MPRTSRGHRNAYQQYMFNNTVKNLMTPKGAMFIVGFFLFFFVIAILTVLLLSGASFFDTPFWKKTLLTLSAIFAFIYTYTYPFWWLMGKIWGFIETACIWLWVKILYPIGMFFVFIFG